MTEPITLLLIKAGALCILLAGIYALRSTDFVKRLTWGSKMSTLGAGLVLAGVALNFENVALKMALAAFLGMVMMGTLVERKR
ncbi:MAG: monovalent cation/H(+) antiporter subunit G [Caldilineaceae bacterium]|nr:monovalent cation/H(+) antiporter subunit G [Caldilineaceae bacterium]